MFTRLADRVSSAAGRPWFFWANIAVTVAWVVAWLVAGRPDGLQIAFINLLTVTTWLLLILDKNAQDRGLLAIQVKLDELVRAIADAQDDLIDAEHMDEAQLRALKQRIKGRQ